MKKKITFKAWLKELISKIKNQSYEFFRNRIVKFAKEHDGFIEADIQKHIAFKKDDGSLIILIGRRYILHF
ncbi:MAG: hypothetical protein QW270_05730 [Candidatus Bathyarchaeia archaeon]